MQAPPTSGTPAQDRRLRVCPACRALNGGTGTFCWQCLRLFNSAEAADGVETAVPPPPSPPASDGTA